jgi:2',3'-cyclic-nucleotide 2'-phosphodiesterase (5'-nucleotidase family)
VAPVRISNRVVSMSVGLLVACATAPPPRDAEVDGASTEAGDAFVDDASALDAGHWDGWPACDPSATVQRLTFVHVNDLHAHYGLDARGASPFARIRHFYERTRLESPYTIFTNGGDDHEKGSVAELLSEGRSTIDIVRAMEFDVRVLGNHDFAWSLDELLDYTTDPHAVVLSANHHPLASEPRWHAEEARVITVGCVRVGFLGLTSTPWDERDRTIEEPFYPELSAQYDYAAEARRVIDAHAGEADVWVAVDHIGQSEDEALARAVPELDVVLSGHSHTYTPSPVSAGGAVVIQSGSFAQFAVRLDVDVDLASHTVSTVHYATQLVANEPPSLEVEGVVEQALATYAPDATRTVGHLMSGGDAPFVADLAARAAIAQHGADAALVDVHTVWGSLYGGVVHPQDFADAFRVERERPGTPGFNSLYRVRVTGEVLAAIAALHGANWRYAGVTSPTPGATYDLVLQKRAALHPDEQLGLGVAFVSSPTPLEEVWATLDAYARAREAACRYLDADASLPSCP